MNMDLLMRRLDGPHFLSPHPGPLPQERGKHAQFPEFSRPLLWNCFMGTHVGGYGATAAPPDVGSSSSSSSSSKSLETDEDENERNSRAQLQILSSSYVGLQRSAA